MAVLQTLHVTAPNIPAAAAGPFKDALATAFWRWYDTHQDDKVKSIKIWFFTHTVRIRDLRQVFEMLFGPHPAY